MMMISLKRITKNVMETDKKKNSGRKATRGSVRDARETFERRLCCSLLVRSQIPDEWKLGKLENSRTTGNSLLARPQGFACAAERGKLPEKQTSHNRKNDGYQSMDRKRPENRDYALGPPSQCQRYVFTVRVFVRVRRNSGFAQLDVLRKRFGKETKASETIERKLGQ